MINKHMSISVLHDDASLYMDCNGKLWYFKKYADTEKEIKTKISLFSKPNINKLRIHLEDIITERNRHPV